jgi:hypothetical protein
MCKTVNMSLFQDNSSTKLCSNTEERLLDQITVPNMNPECPEKTTQTVYRIKVFIFQLTQ